MLFGPQHGAKLHYHGGAPHGARAVDISQRWDSYWFLNIARNGYKYYGPQDQGNKDEAFERETNITPFPLYPLLIKGLSPLCRKDLSKTGLFISLYSFLGLCFLLYRYVQRREGEEIAARSLLYLALYPTAFIYQAIYSESLFLLLIVLAFFEAQRGRFLSSGCAGMLASMTRISGVLLAPCLLVDFFDQAPPGKKRAGLFKGLAAATLTGLGLINYFLYLYKLTGDPWAYFTAQQGWVKHTVWPWMGLMGMFSPDQPPALSYMHLITVLFFVPLVIISWKKLPRSEALFFTLGTIFPLCSSNLMGLPRYLMVMFPAFILLARLGKNNAVHTSLVSIFSLLQGVILWSWLSWWHCL